MKKVLVVDDDDSLRHFLSQGFAQDGWKVVGAAGATEALAQFRSAPSALVITDMRLKEGNGLALLQAIRELEPATPVIVLTGFANVNDAVAVMRFGACDYLPKPVRFAELREAANRLLLESSELPAAAPPAVHVPEAASGMVAGSPAMQHALSLAASAARTDADILIEAESGTGKEMLARFIHQNSPRRNHAFVALNCAGIPETLLESELFGYVRGAFTGATATRAGRFEQADGGTLLLDEIGEMPLPLQPKLLRVLQEREVDRLGDARPIRVNVRIVATTNRSLSAMVAEGKFRADLYYRLNVVPLALPPLRDRREDIPQLVKYFLAKYGDAKTAEIELAPDFLARLQSHCWPGNIRELENTVRRALALSARVEAWKEWIAPAVSTPVAAAPPQPAEKHRALAGTTWQQAERELLVATLEATHGNRTRAAEMLGLSVRTIRNKIRQYQLPPNSRAANPLVSSHPAPVAAPASGVAL